MNRFQLSRAAQTDLESIGEYLAKTAGAEQAVDVLNRIRVAFQKLAEMPGIGHYREDLLDQRYRFWRAGGPQRGRL
jgi:plasmid stabilization system protein ParE